MYSNCPFVDGHSKLRHKPEHTFSAHTQARNEVVNTHVTKPIMPHGEWFHTHECEDLCRNRITMRADLHAIPNIRMPALGVAGELCASLLATQHVFE